MPFGLPPAPPAQVPTLLPPHQQPLVSVIGMGPAPADVGWSEQGPILLSRREGGANGAGSHSGPEFYPTPLRATLPLISALETAWGPAQPHRTVDRQGKPVDQSQYLVAYGLLTNPEFAIAPDQSRIPDPVTGSVSWARAASAPQWGAQAFRMRKSTPDLLVGAGAISYREQVVAQIAMLDCDLSDLWPKTNEAYRKWYRSPDPTVVEKLPWDRERWDIWRRDWLPRILREVPWFGRAACWYTTQNGWRAVYLLDRAVPVTGGKGSLEDIIRGLMISLAAAGVATDMGCCDWTRLMRVPRCYKGDKKLGELPFFRVSWNGVDCTMLGQDPSPSALQAWPPESFPWHTGTDIQDLRESPYRSLIDKAYGIHTPDGGKWQEQASVPCGMMPEDAQAAAILQGDDGKPTPLAKMVHLRLTNWGKKDPAKSKQRDHILRARRLVSLLIGKANNLEEFAIAHGKSGLHHGNLYASMEFCQILQEDLDLTTGITPQAVYAFLVDSYLRAMEARRATDPGSARDQETVRQEAWRAAEGAFAHSWRFREEWAKADQQADAAIEGNSQLPTIEQAQAQGAIVETLHEWLADPREHLMGAYKKYLLISTAMGHSVMQLRKNASGDIRVCLSDPIKNVSNWIPAIREAGHELIRYQDYNDKDDKLFVRSEVELMAEYGTPVVGMEADRLIDRHQLKYITEGGYRKLIYVHRLPGIAEDVDPIEHRDIHRFLTCMGGQYRDHFLDWLALFCKIERPLPALYIHGSAGIGKNMLMKALELLTSRKCSAPFHQALGNFQDHYADTFFITADEDPGMNPNQFAKDITGVIRRMIGGQYDIIDIKGAKGIRLRGQWRLYVSANNADVLSMRRDMTDADIEALQQRVFYLDVVEQSGDLRQIIDEAGGWDGSNGKGPGTGPGEWPRRIAEHIKWLEHNRVVVHPDNRFLMKAPVTPWHDENKLKTSNSADVCASIQSALRCIERGQKPPGIWIFRNKNQVVVNISEFESYVENTKPNKIKNLALAFKPLIIRKLHPRIREEGAPKKGPGTQKWVMQIDIRAVINLLHKSGLDCDFRELFGAAMWEAVAPDHIRKELENSESTDEEAAGAPQGHVHPQVTMPPSAVPGQPAFRWPTQGAHPIQKGSP